MSSPSVQNTGGTNTPHAIQPTSSSTEKGATDGQFNDREVAIVTSGENDNRFGDLESVNFWKGDFGKELENYAERQEAQHANKRGLDATKQRELEGAAQDAQKGGLLKFLQKTVKAIINFFTRDPSSLSASTVPFGTATPPDLKTQFVIASLNQVIDAGPKIDNVYNNLVKPESKVQFEAVKQAVATLDLPSQEEVAQIDEQQNINAIANDRTPKIKGDLHRAVQLLAQVYDAKAKISSDTPGSISFGQIIENAQESINNLKDPDDRLLRNWMLFALDCVKDCSQVIKNASENRPTDNSTFEKIQRSVNILSKTPTNQLPSVAKQ